MGRSHQKSIFIFILFLSVCIESCIGKGGAKKELSGHGTPGTKDATNYYSDIESTDNSQGEGNHKKLDSTNSSKSTTQKSEKGILIGGFNMHKVGFQKFRSNPRLLDTIVRIVKRYDILAITEITDRKEGAMKELIEQVNQQSKHEYHYKFPRRVGKSKNKEQYAVIYRAQNVQIISDTLYDNPQEDIFKRAPLIVEFSFKGRDEIFGLVVVQIRSTEAVKEINALVDVHDWDVIIIGDFNADCTVVRKKDWPSINLRNQDKFLWLIGDDVDTTVASGTKCAYDRIVISGELLQSVVNPKSARTYKFDQKWNLNEEEALQISERYPIEFSIKFNETVKATTNTGNSNSKSATYFNVPVFTPNPSLIFILHSLFITGVMPAFRENLLW